jgi:hypothetical protein
MAWRAHCHMITDTTHKERYPTYRNFNLYGVALLFSRAERKRKIKTLKHQKKMQKLVRTLTINRPQMAHQSETITDGYEVLY